MPRLKQNMGSATVPDSLPPPPPSNPPPEQDADPHLLRNHGHHNYEHVLTLIKEQLDLPPQDDLKDIPCFRIPDLTVVIENNWVPRVQELLQKGKAGGEVSSAEMGFLRRHIGWLERQCHENALKTDRANYTLTNRQPDFLFSENRKVECTECQSSHSRFNSMDPCFPLDHNGPQLPRDLRSGGCWKDGKKAIYIGTQNHYLHPAHQEKVLNLSITRKIGYPTGFENSPGYLPGDFSGTWLYQQLEKRGEVLGCKNHYPLIVEFTKSYLDDDPTTPLSHHLIGFLKVLSRLRLRYNGPIAMVLYPPLPRLWEDTESYALELEEYERDSQLAMFLGEVVGMVVYCFSLFETNVPDNKGWYYRKKSWHKECLYGRSSKITKEFLVRQKEELDLLVRSLLSARGK